MLLGIDYGTTRTVVAAVDRGNFPIASFQNEGGDTQEWYPSLIAASDSGELLFGFDAAAKQREANWHLLRSFKRQLGMLGADSSVRIGERRFTALALLTEFLAQLRRDLQKRSNLRARKGAEFEAMISVPANANSNQRFLTIEAFRRAGFAVRGVINEPSAAGVEYAHHHLGANGAATREFVVVYDLGGGTFDASVISMAERRHEVVSSEGIAHLGGDDFDNLLLELALERARIDNLPANARAELLQECREKKEELHPNTRKIVIDVGRAVEGAGEVIVGTADFYERSQPLIAQTIEAMDRAMERSPAGAELDWRSVAAVYMVGGSSDLPIVARTLRERYGRQVRKSPYPHAAAAIGLAIAASADEGYTLRERFTRHFGVWREAAEGREITFDVIFGKDTPLPEGPGEKLTTSRRYRAGHNVGHFRYLECGRVEHRGHPVGDMTFWDEIHFPLAPDLQHEREALASFPVERMPESEQIIEELYSCDRAGIIEVEILNCTANYRRGYSLRPGTEK